MKRRIKINGKAFVVTYDEDGVLDTIERNGEFLAATHRDVRRIRPHVERLRNGLLPAGWEWDNEPRP